MAVRLDWFRNALGVLLGLVVGFIAMSPVALKAIAMLPVISILTPGQNQEVAGYVTFWATADSEGVASVQFRVDGQDFGSLITAGSCRASWDSTQAADGLHTVQAIGRDQFDNPITSQAVTVRVNNFVPPPTAPPPTAPPPTAPPPTAPPPTAPPPTAPPPTPTPTPPAPPGPPSNTPVATVTILSPSPNTAIKGLVPVFVAVPAQAQTVAVHLKTAWGDLVGTWQVPLTPSASSSTIQVNAEIGNLTAASYALIATASVNGTVITSDPVPVRVENTTVVPPAPAPTQPGVARAPSRFRSPAAEAIDPSLTAGPARPRPEAQAAGERAGTRTSSSTASQTKAGSKSLFGSGSQPKKSTAPATTKSTSLPAGSVVTIGLGSCTGTDPYAKHPTLKGECVSGTWFPRVRKAEAKRQQ